MSTAVTVTAGFVGLSLAISGVLLVLRRSRIAGLALTVVGLLNLAAAIARTQDHPDLAVRLLLVAGVGVGPLAVAAYPTLRRGHPVDLVAATALALAIPTVLIEPDQAVLVGYLAALVLIAHTWWRIETATGGERTALIWLATTVTTLLLVIGVISFALDGAEASLAPAFLLACALGPVLVLGVSQPDLVDVRGLVVRIAETASALLVVMATFFLLVGFAAFLDVEDPSLGALGLLGALAAASYHPTQVLMRGVMDELLFGRRPDPLGAAASLAGQIGDDPADTIDLIRHALVLPYAALVVPGRPMAVSGTEVVHTSSVELAGLGSLVVGLRPGDLALSTGDRAVLALVAPLLAQTLRARALADALQESRERTITALEDERRRLRRDLHDGLGPRLSGIAFSTDAVRNLLRTDPDQADALLVTMRAETTVAIEDIRSLVYAMRPPALDELGLVPALRQQTLGLRTPTGRPLAVAVSAPEHLGELTAAVEVAAYRIVTEALANVARHSGASSATVALASDAAGLSIEIRDAGGGAAASWSPGVGLASMHERALELGGTLSAGPAATGGRVAAYLPLP